MAVCANVHPRTDQGGFDDGGGANEDVVGEFEGVVGKYSVKDVVSVKVS